MRLTSYLFVIGLIATFVQVIQLRMIIQPVTEKLSLTPGSVALIGMWRRGFGLD